MSDETRTPSTQTSAEDVMRRSLTPPERILLLDMWQRSGLTAREFSALVGVGRKTLFDWKRRFDRLGPAGLADQNRGAPRGSRLPEPNQRAILMLKNAHPEWGCERIREVLLRGEGYCASAGAIAHVLQENGYELEEVETVPHAPGGRRADTSRRPRRSASSPTRAPARLVYPNYRDERPEKRVQFFHYDPEERGWYVYGLGTVTPNGAQVLPDPRTRIYEFTGAMINSGSSPPADGAPPGDECCNDGDPVNLATGLFELEQTDLYLPDVLPISVTRTYRTRDADIRPFGRGATHPYAIFLWSAQQYTEADLILPDGGRIHYVRTSPGTGFVDAVFAHQETETTSATPTGFYKSVFSWNGNGWDLRLKDGTVYVFGENAPLQAIRDRYGNTITIHRTNGQIGNITRVVSPHGRWIEFTYSSNRITQAKDNIGRTVSYTYDGQNRLWKVTDPLNQVTEYTYDSDHRLLTVKNRNGVVYVTNEYTTTADAPTPVGWVKKQTFADGGTYQFAYTVVNGKSTQTEVTDPLNNLRRVTLNSNGYTVTDTRAVGTPEQTTTSSTRQTGTNFVGSSTNAGGHQTSYTYDANGNVLTITRLAGMPDAVTTFTYEPLFSQVATITDPLNHTTTFWYDAAGNMTNVTDPLQHTTTVIYNSAGQLTSVTDALQHTAQFTYQGGDLVKVRNPLGLETTRFVDAVGQLLTTIDAMGRVTRYEYDTVGRTTRVTDPSGGTTTFSYYPEGHIQTLTDARNNATSYAYDSMGRLVSRLDPVNKAETLTYDLNGRTYQHTDRKGQVTTRTYDALNRLRQLSYADGSTVTYTYDLLNRATSIVDSVAGTITRAYDDLGRLRSETTPQGTAAYTYDAANRRADMTVAGQPTVTYTYDSANRLTTVTQGATSVTLTYDEVDPVEFATLDWVDWFNHLPASVRRILGGKQCRLSGDSRFAGLASENTRLYPSEVVMRAHLRRLPVRLTPWIISVTIACGGASQLKNGMQEADVIRLLGEPKIVTDRTLMSIYFFDEQVKTCLPKATKVLVYDRWIRNDVSVAIDAKGTVVCFEVVNFF